MSLITACDLCARFDKHCSGYKHWIELLELGPSLIPSMIEKSLKISVEADYVLMDIWFTQQSLIQSIVKIGLDVNRNGQCTQSILFVEQ